MKNKHFNIITSNGVRNIPYLYKFKYYGHVFVVHHMITNELKMYKYIQIISHFKTGASITLDKYGQDIKSQLKEKISSRFLDFQEVSKKFPIINK